MFKPQAILLSDLILRTKDIFGEFKKRRNKDSSIWKTSLGKKEQF